MSFKAIGLKSIKLLFLVLLTTLILTVTACSSPPPEPVPSPQQPTEAPEEGQTITIITPDAANVDVVTSPKYQIQTRLTDFELLSVSEGIAWGVTKNSLRMYITHDNGHTWANISPSTTIQFSSNPIYGKDIFFTDPKNGWIIRGAYGITETIVLRTHDGGLNWKVSSLGDDNPISSIYFISPKRGWLLTSWDTTNYKESKALYSTINGGATWDLVMQNEQYSPISPNPSLPIPGITTGMIFRSTTHGFVTLQTATLPKIFISKDGGNSWRHGQPFIVEEQLKGCDRLITGKPVFYRDSSTNGWLSVGCETDKSKSVIYHGYFTSNGVDTWKFAPFTLNKLSGINRNVPPTFINASVGWALKGNLLYHTKDQGVTWRPLPVSTVLQSMLSEYPEVVKIQFYSEKLGWLLIEKKEDKKSILLQSSNGGISWRVM